MLIYLDLIYVGLCSFKILNKNIIDLLILTSIRYDIMLGLFTKYPYYVGFDVGSL